MDTSLCTRCKQPTLEGNTASHRAALPYRLDPEPLTTVQELQAYTSGRLCWTLHAGGAVFRRTVTGILTRPAGHTPRQTVHADHQCRQGEL